VTPLHLAALAGHIGVIRILLKHGADATIRDSKHDSPAAGWAEFFRRTEAVRILRGEDVWID
jgi:ankyrin repeat protein